jgi:predicted extracellular nuclease
VRLGTLRRPVLSAVGSIAILVGLLPAVAVTPALAASPDLVISQVYGAGGNSGALYQNDYVELYNRGAAAVDLDAHSIQYASATGTGNFGSNANQLTELPPYVLNPGAYILIIEAGGINGSPMPTPNITDGSPIAMAAGAGKVAIVTGDASLGCNGGSTPCPAAALARIIDLVGYGTGASGANFFEGSGPAPSISITLADFRAGNGATDTDDNAADFTAAAPNPRTTGDIAPTVVSTTPADGAGGVAEDAGISITFSEPITIAGTWFTISCTVSGGHTALAAGGPTTYTLNPSPDFVAGDTCTVTIVASNIHDNDANDPPDTMAANYVFSFSTEDTCALPFTHAYDIQGSGSATPIPGAVTTQGVVVGDDEGPSPALRGFYLEDQTGDGDPATSDAVFVFNGNRNDVALGDVVRVSGTAAEFQDQTQVSASTVRVCGTGSVDPADITLPQPSTDFFERYEGMLVRMPQTLSVTEHFQLGRFGQVVVSSGGRQMTPTAVAEPGPAAQAVAAANLLNRVIVDDPTQDQDHDPILFGRFGNPLSASNTLRIGDTMTDATGVLTYTWAGNAASGNAWRLRPVEALGGGVPDFQPTNPRPAAPVVDGSLRVGAMNVLNYFTTLDTPANATACGPTGGQECRGANTTQELDRQRAKIVEAMAGLNADVIGLMELQNGPDVPAVSTSALNDLVGALRTKTGNPAWDYIRTGSIGTDAIKVGIAYDASRVTPVGAYALLDSTVDPRFIDTKNRPSLAQTFDQVDGGGRLTVVVNHLKSKGSDCNDVGDPDTGDGSGNCNLTRTAAAHALVDWIVTDPTHSGDRDVLVVGDMNSYAKEAPIDAFIDAGYQNVIDRFAGGDAYSYVFDGQTGYLDHALASPTLAAQLTDAAEWHINADEPADLDYNTDFKSAAQIANLYAPDAYRASDHDPLVVGMNLLHYAFSGYQAPVDNPPIVNAVKAGVGVPVKFSLGGDRGLNILFRNPTSTAYTCETGAPIDVLETEAAGGSGLAYDPATDTYTYVWKTLKSWSSTCRELDLTFRDGTFRTADFSFRK